MGSSLEQFIGLGQAHHRLCPHFSRGYYMILHTATLFAQNSNYRKLRPISFLPNLHHLIFSNILILNPHTRVLILYHHKRQVWAEDCLMIDAVLSNVSIAAMRCWRLTLNTIQDTREFSLPEVTYYMIWWLDQELRTFTAWEDNASVSMCNVCKKHQDWKC